MPSLNYDIQGITLNKSTILLWSAKFSVLAFTNSQINQYQVLDQKITQAHNNISSIGIGEIFVSLHHKKSKYDITIVVVKYFL